LNITGAGSFECPVILFLDDHGIRQVETVLHGVGVSRGGPANVQGP
jgi:hypothetical protein